VRTTLSLLLAVVLSIVAAPAGASRLAPLAPQPPAGRTVVLDGVTVRLRPGTTQVVTVNHRRGHHARVALHVLRADGWHEVRATTDGRIGYGGLVPGRQRRQGTGTTPLGTYPLPWTFGTHPRQPAWSLRHREIRRGDFWVQDNASAHYNTYRNLRRGGFRPRTSERLTDFGAQYEYVVVMDYNPRRVRHRGAGIFLHVNGRGATAGCVSAPRRFLRMLMVRLDPAQAPVIAVGR
jgi:L,D-peptidoglycan transpeptidase YkuD (ErfK/YbiS/YcfS/YnhG family)